MAAFFSTVLQTAKEFLHIFFLTWAQKVSVWSIVSSDQNSFSHFGYLILYVFDSISTRTQNFDFDSVFLARRFDFVMSPVSSN
jgi:hypothetical protein